MQESTVLQTALKNQQFITPLPDKKIHIYKEGKTSYANLFISEDIVYASSIKESDSVYLGKVIITNLKMLAGREIRPTDKIKVTQLLPAMIVGELVGVYQA